MKFVLCGSLAIRKFQILYGYGDVLSKQGLVVSQIFVVLDRGSDYDAL